MAVLSLFFMLASIPSGYAADSTRCPQEVELLYSQPRNLHPALQVVTIGGQLKIKLEIDTLPGYKSGTCQYFSAGVPRYSDGSFEVRLIESNEKGPYLQVFGRFPVKDNRGIPGYLALEERLTGFNRHELILAPGVHAHEVKLVVDPISLDFGGIEGSVTPAGSFENLSIQVYR